MASKKMAMVAICVAAIVVAAGAAVILRDDLPGDKPKTPITPDTPITPPLPPPSTFGDVGPRGTYKANQYDDPADGVYVSTTGNDTTADGSISRPYKSINAAINAAPSGGTVILRGGTYHEHNNVRITQADITVKSAKGEWAVIDFPLAHDPDTTWKQTSAVRFDPASSGSKLQGVEVIGGFYAVCLETKWDWGPPDRSGASNIIIEDCILHDSRNDTVKVKPNCDNVTIRYNEIYNSGREHIGSSGFTAGERNAEGIDNVNGDNMKVQNNYIHDICSTGVYAKGGAKNALIENNLIKRTYAAGIMVGFDTSPDFFDSDNKAYYENFNCIVRNNLIIDTGWEGIGMYASRNAEVYNNTMVNAVTYGTGKYHSPIYFGIATQDYDNWDGCPANISPNVHHNIICQPSAYAGRMIDIRYIVNFHFFPSDRYRDLSALDGALTIDNNCYYLSGGTARFTDMRPPAPLTNAGLSAWKAHIGGDGGSIEADPGLDANYRPANPLCSDMGCMFA